MRPARPDSQRAPRTRLRVPCSYQGGKQRVAAEIAEILVDETGIVDSGAEFFDLCCGSGAISVEMINKGVDPSKITMLDRGPWGFFGVQSAPASLIWRPFQDTWMKYLEIKGP